MFARKKREREKKKIVELAASMGGPGRWPNKRRQRQHQRTGPTGDGVDEPISAPNRPAYYHTRRLLEKQMRAVTPHERRRWMQQEGNLGLLNRNRPPRKRIGSHQRVVLASWAMPTGSRHHSSPSWRFLFSVFFFFSLFSPSGHRRGQMRLHQHRYRPKAPCPCTATTTIYKFASSGAFSCVPVSFFLLRLFVS